MAEILLAKAGPMLEKYLQNCSALDLGSVNSLLPNLKLHDIFRLLDLLFKASFWIFHVCLALDLTSSNFLS